MGCSEMVLSKDLKEEKDEIFWGRALQKKGANKGKTGQECAQCVWGKEWEAREVADAKAVWPCGALEGLWFVFTVTGGH